MLAQVFGIVFAYDKLKIAWAGYDANPERCMNKGFVELSECDWMGMCHIGGLLGLILCIGMILKGLEG